MNINMLFLKSAFTFYMQLNQIMDDLLTYTFTKHIKKISMAMKIC